MTESCRFETRPDGSVSLSGPLTFGSVPALYRDLERDLAESGPVKVIDLAAVSAADSAGLALLLEWQARQRRRGKELRMQGAPDNLMRLAQLCESVELLQLTGRNPEQ